MAMSLISRLRTQFRENVKMASQSGSAKKASPLGISHITFDRLRSPRFTIVPPPSDFVGRREELAELLENFDRGVLITSINGDAGVGTTALARRLAFALADDYLDGCLELDLRGGMPTMEEPMNTVEAQRCLLRPFHPYESLPEDARALNKLYRSTFSDYKVLLLLDNAVSGTQLRRLLPRSPSAAIVTSTQAELSLNWAKLYHLELGGLRPDDARELLLRISERREDRGQNSLDKIAERFEYFPLALRVTASLLKEPFDWTPREILRRFANVRKSLLALLGPDAAGLSVQTALDMIYGALPQEARSQFEDLAVFPTSFPQSAVAAVWDVDSQKADETLIALARYNLLDYRTANYTYVQHDLVRLYAQTLLLGQMKQTDTVVVRYANYVLEQAKRANERYQESESSMPEAMMRFDVLWPDLWRAWNRMNGSDLGWPVPEDTERWLCDFPGAVLEVLNATRSLEERLTIFSRALESAQNLGDLEAEAAHSGQLGRIHMAMQNPEQALHSHDRQLEIAYELHDRYHEADALMNIGQACGELGDVKRARESWRQALALFNVIGDPRATQVKLWLESLEEKISPQSV